MKRMTAVILLCVFLCSGCQSKQPEITRPGNVTPSSDSPAPITPDAEVDWFEKIYCRTNACYEWADYAVETADAFFYIAEDGLWRFDKTTKTDDLIFASDDLYGAFLHEDFVYYCDGQTIYRSPLDGNQSVTVWEYAMCPEECKDEYAGIQDFQVYDGCLYIRVDGLYMVKYDLSGKTSECLLEDVSCFTLSGNACYFTEHASRTFSVYKKDMTTGETVMLRGDDKAWDDDTKTRYDTPVSLHGQLFYTIREINNIFLYNENGEDGTLLDAENEYTSVRILEDPDYENLCYYVDDGKQILLYERDAQGNTTLLLTLDAEANPCFYSSVLVTASAVFWQSTQGGTLNCLIRA